MARAARTVRHVWYVQVGGGREERALGLPAFGVHLDDSEQERRERGGLANLFDERRRFNVGAFEMDVV